MNFRNFVGRKLYKSILDFDNIIDVILGYLNIQWFLLLRIRQISLVFLKNSDFSKTFLLGLKEIREDILETLVCFSLGKLLWLEALNNLENDLLNCAETYCLNNF